MSSKCKLDNDLIMEDMEEVVVISNIEDVIIVVVVCIEGKSMPEIFIHVI